MASTSSKVRAADASIFAQVRPMNGGKTLGTRKDFNASPRQMARRSKTAQDAPSHTDQH